MSDHTPEPCGCRVVMEPVDLSARRGVITEPTIIYCPTHAAAFETARRFKLWQDEDYPAQLSELRSQLKEREAEVELIVHGLESRIGEAESRYTTLQEAASAALEWAAGYPLGGGMDEHAAADVYERLRQLIPTTEMSDELERVREALEYPDDQTIDDLADCLGILDSHITQDKEREADGTKWYLQYRKARDELAALQSQLKEREAALNEAYRVAHNAEDERDEAERKLKQREAQRDKAIEHQKTFHAWADDYKAQRDELQSRYTTLQEAHEQLKAEMEVLRERSGT